MCYLPDETEEEEKKQRRLLQTIETWTIIITWLIIAGLMVFYFIWRCCH
jgi:heme/copper-type cytochrome/quinol oxidase subunit 2